MDTREVVLECLREIAPDRDPGAIDPNRDLRDELDLDSMDFLRFVQALHRKLGVEVPESEYASVRTLRGCIERCAREATARG
jgi:acyl carrier protein